MGNKEPFGATHILAHQNSCLESFSAQIRFTMMKFDVRIYYEFLS